MTPPDPELLDDDELDPDAGDAEGEPPDVRTDPVEDDGSTVEHREGDNPA